MSDQAALLQAILDNPEDDLPRLALADWLEENGGTEQLARADLIRTEIELERLLASSPERYTLEAGARETLRQVSGVFRMGGRLSTALEARDTELIRRYGPHWAGACARSPFHHGFRRGFVDEIRTTGVNFIRHADRVFAETPISALRLDGGLKNELNREFWQSSFLRQLRYLNCCCVALRPHGARDLANCPLERLRELSLWATGIGSQGMEFLAGSTALSLLVRLDLGSAHIGPEGASTLARSPVFGQLRWLRLWNNRVGDRGVEALAGSPHLGNLTELNLGQNDLTQGGLQALAASPSLTRLTTLRLTANRIGLSGARALADSPNLAGLKRLSISTPNVGAARITWVEQPAIDLLRERFGEILELNRSPMESASF
jgi:uncharacterized protein (TIGR02996 family)